MTKDQNSQEGSEKRGKTREETKEIRGHMALRNNVNRIRLALCREVKPLEYFIVDFIIDRTIGWRQKEARIKIIEFVEHTGKRDDEVYNALKRLVSRGIILRRKFEHNLYFSLNEEYFGGLLIKRHEEALLKRRSKIKVVVDNSKSYPEIPGSLPGKSGDSSRKFRGDSTAIPGKNQSEDCESIQENAALKTFPQDIPLNTSLKNSKSGDGERESCTLEESESGKKARLEAMAAIQRLAIGGMRSMPR